MKELFDDFTIKEIAESMFEYIIEAVGDWTGLCYEDLSSSNQERYLKSVKGRLELLFKEEFQKIKDNWTNEPEEIKRLKRENEELKRRLAMEYMDFGEDMGK